MPIFTLNTTAEAIDSKLSKEMGEAMFKKYEKGENVMAQEYEKNDSYIIIENRYILPKNVVTEKSSGKKKTENSDEEIKESESILDRANILGTTTNSIQAIEDRSKAYKNGIVYGSALGLIAGLLLKKKVVWFVVGGALVGGHVALEINKGKQVKHEII